MTGDVTCNIGNYKIGMEIKECYLSKTNKYLFVKCYYNIESEEDNIFIYRLSGNKSSIELKLSYKGMDTSSQVYNAIFTDQDTFICIYTEQKLYILNENQLTKQFKEYNCFEHPNVVGI